MNDCEFRITDSKSSFTCFDAVDPGKEEQSWERFYKEAVGRFLNGTYAGNYEEELIAEFDKLLSGNPPWK